MTISSQGFIIHHPPQNMRESILPRSLVLSQADEQQSLRLPPGKQNGEALGIVKHATGYRLEHLA